jgi:endonuclease III
MNEFDLQWNLIYSVVVAGKSAKFANRAISRLLLRIGAPLPFDQIRKWSDIRVHCEIAKTGNYGKLARCLQELIDSSLDLRTCDPAALEQIHGIGPKTSRFFIMWTREEADYSALDVHVLRWLQGLGYKVPDNTPQSLKLYGKIEQWFLAEAEKRGVTARVLDHAIWVEGAGHEEANEQTKRLIQPHNEQEKQ